MRAKHECWGILRLTISEFVWLIAINLLIFQSPMKDVTPFANYFDEFATVGLLVSSVFVFILRNGKANRLFSNQELIGLVFLVGFTLVGLLGNYYSGIQMNVKPILVDLLACTKFVLVYFSSIVVFDDKHQLYRVLLQEAKFLLIVMIPFALLNQFFDFGMRFDRRYGLHSFNFLFKHPSTYSQILAGILLLLLTDAGSNKKWIAVCLALISLSLRSTSIAFSAACIVLLINGVSGKMRLTQLMLIGISVVSFGWGQIQYYFFSIDGGARARLTAVSLEIANRFSPIGSGFATYASNITAQPGYYSPLYYQYGLNSVHGLVPGDISFLSDTFWPIVVGQFGWMGLILFIFCLLSLLIGRISFSKNHGASWKIAGLFFIYLLLASAGSPAFFHPNAVLFTICFALANGELLACSNTSADDVI